MTMDIRKRRRDRTLNRIANQKRLDAIAYKKINGNMTTSLDTWGGTICPECHKSVPTRAFVVGGDVRWSDTCILSVGTSVAPQYCHRNKQRCASESAKEDPYRWKESLMYQEQNR
jgi:hypothetical protein